MEKWSREIFRITDIFEDLKVPNEEEPKSKEAGTTTSEK